jgi:PAS domain S-box-containing protein
MLKGPPQERGEGPARAAEPLPRETGKRGGRKTAKKEAQKKPGGARHQGREMFRKLFEHANEAILVHTLTTREVPGRFIEANPAACRMLGYTRDELLRMGPSGIVPEQFHPLLADMIRRAATEDAFVFEIQLRRNNGTLFPVETSGRLMDYQGRKVWLSYIRDITERKAAEAALKKSEAKYRAIYEDSFDGLFITSPAGKILDMNKKGIAMFGYDTIEDIRNLDLEQDVYAFPPDRKRILAMVNAKGSAEYEVIVKKKNGEHMATHCVLTSVRDRAGTIISYHGIIRDITEKKRADEELLRKNEQLAAANEELEVREEELQESIDELNARQEELRQSEEKFHTIADFTYDWELWLGQDGRLLYCSPACERITGYSPHEFASDPGLFDRIVHPDDRAVFREHLRTAWGEREAGAVDFRIVRRDGAVRWIGHACQAVTTPDGTPLGRRVSNRDITEQKAAEEALRLANAYNRCLIETSLDPAVVINADGKIADVNIATEVATGFVREQLIGTDFSKYFTEPEKAQEGYRQAFRDGQVRNYPLVLRGSSGRTIPVLYNATVFRNDAGTVIGVFAAARDITALVTEQEKLRESETRFRQVAESAGEWIWEVDADGVYTYSSPAIEPMLGYRPDEVVGRMHFYDLFAPERKDELQTMTQEAFAKKQPLKDFINVNLHRDGSRVIISTSGVPVLDPGGKFVGYRGADTDITARTRAEEVIRDYNKKLKQGIEERTAELRESELKHRILFESSRDAIMTLEPPDWRFTAGNPATVLMFRAEDEAAFAAKTPWEFSPEFQPDGQPSDEKAKEMIRTAMREGSHYFEWTHRRLTGEDFPATVLLTRFTWKGRDILQATVRDITEEKKAEEAIRASLEEKTVLLREIHHRVRNNLQIITSLISLQLRQFNDPRLQQIMTATQNRVKAMAAIHENLCQSESMASIEMAGYFRAIATQLFSIYANNRQDVALEMAMEQTPAGMDEAVLLGLIVNELVSNALRHAFPPGTSGTIRISGRRKDHTLQVEIENTGMPLPPGFDWRKTDSLGLRLVMILVDQLDGTVDLDRSGGTKFTIVIPEKTA